ncbi:MAG: gephyrin-like molybdotransferase Glp [Mycobacteriales bacterium]|nr:molybdopterin molybdotransferase MoeA [Frankia sp.]
MISVDEHLDRVLTTVHVLEPIDLQLLDAHGCVLAADVTSATAVPAHDIAAVDGYAVRVGDLRAATPESPVEIPVIGDVSGDAPLLSVQPGLSARITRGSRVPAGADAVVPTEWTDGGTARVRVSYRPEARAFITAAGSDIRAGEVLLRAGTVLAAGQVGLLAAIGRRSVPAYPRPRVVVVTAGGDDESARNDATSHALTGAAIEAGAVGYHVGTVAADARGFSDTIEDHLIQADVVVVAVGAGRGFSVVNHVLGQLGTVRFADVAISPGPRQGFGTIGPDATPIFVVPDDLVGALVSFEVFVRPTLRRMLGARVIARPQISAAISQRISSVPGRRHFVPVYVERQASGWTARLAPGATSAVGALATANALAVIPDAAADVAAGVAVTTWLLERRGR